ncbi:zinc finger protein 28 [Aphelenchoides avenae]|nr:zinc finger protein 28 [Aphelenchus avenae]
MSLTKAPTLFKCVQCGKEYNKVSSLRVHMWAHRGKLHECDQCDKKYKRREALLEHKQIEHTEDGHFECDECEKKYTRRRTLLEHKRIAHAQVGKFECEQCGKKYRWRGSLREHKKNAHAQAGRFKCNECGKSYPHKVALRNHKRYHSEHTLFTCDSECGLQSATRSEYLEHLRCRHAAQHPAICKCVSLNAKRVQHVATNLGNSVFAEADGTMKCIDGGCDFETTCARRMESHKEQCHHDSYQPVLHCASCKTWFTCPSGLRSHNAVKHQGERRFKCDQCGYITNNQFGFTKHQTSCQQGKALGNIRLKRAAPTTEKLDVKKESPRDVGFGKVYEALKKGKYPPVKYAIKEVGPKGGKSAELEAKRMRQFQHKVVVY